MENTENSVTNQEKIAALIASIPFLFFVPHVMEKKTEFTVFFMQQGFGLTLFFIAILMIRQIPFLGFFWIFYIVICILAVYLGWSAWNGKVVTIDYLFEYSNKVIAFFRMTDFFRK